MVEYLGKRSEDCVLALRVELRPDPRQTAYQTHLRELVLAESKAIGRIGKEVWQIRSVSILM